MCCVTYVSLLYCVVYCVYVVWCAVLYYCVLRRGMTKRNERRHDVYAYVVCRCVMYVRVRCDVISCVGFRCSTLKYNCVVCVMV